MSRRMSTSSGYKRRGFTLVEVLVALALFAALLAASTAVLVQVSAAWAAQADDPIVDRHAEGLERFLRRVFSESGAAGVTAPAQDRLSEGALLGVLPPADLPWTNLLATSGGTVRGLLVMPQEGGLWLYWNTSGETTLGVTESHRVMLSPWVTAATVYIYDTNDLKWVPVEPGSSVDNVGGAGTATASRVLRVEINRSGQSRILEIPIPKAAR